MTRRNRLEVLCAVAIVLALLGMVAAVRVVSAQDANAPKAAIADAAPEPEQLKAARKVFIGNAGVDAASFDAFERAGDINQPYNLFYAAMKRWGRYELVGSPEGADLVMEIRFSAPMTDCGKIATYKPAMELAVLDGKTHFQLWALTAPVEGAYRKSTWNKNVEKGAANLVESLKRLM